MPSFRAFDFIREPLRLSSVFHATEGNKRWLNPPRKDFTIIVLRATDTVDKLAKGEICKEMLAAGIAAAAAAISASPKAHRAIRDAGLDAADTRFAGRHQDDYPARPRWARWIAEAVAEAAQRVMSGKWSTEGSA